MDRWRDVGNSLDSFCHLDTADPPCWQPPLHLSLGAVNLKSELWQGKGCSQGSKRRCCLPAGKVGKEPQAKRCFQGVWKDTSLPIRKRQRLVFCLWESQMTGRSTGSRVQKWGEENAELQGKDPKNNSVLGKVWGEAFIILFNCISNSCLSPMSWSTAPVRRLRTDRIRAQTCSGSSAQCQQPAAGLPCAIYILVMSKKCFKGTKGKQSC